MDIKPCPFCGCEMTINAVGRDWWKVAPVNRHIEFCPIEDVEFSYSMSAPKSDIAHTWNIRPPIENPNPSQHCISTSPHGCEYLGMCVHCIKKS